MDKVSKFLLDTFDIDLKGPKQTKAKEIKEIKEKLVDDRATVKILIDDPLDDLAHFIKLLKDKKINELVDLIYDYENSEKCALVSEGASNLVDVISEPLRRLIQKVEWRKEQQEFYTKLTATMTEQQKALSTQMAGLESKITSIQQQDLEVTGSSKTETKDKKQPNKSSKEMSASTSKQENLEQEPLEDEDGRSETSSTTKHKTQARNALYGKAHYVLVDLLDSDNNCLRVKFLLPRERKSRPDVTVMFASKFIELKGKNFEPKPVKSKVPKEMRDRFAITYMFEEEISVEPLLSLSINVRIAIDDDMEVVTKLVDDRNKLEMTDVYGIIGNDTYDQINDHVDMILNPAGTCDPSKLISGFSAEELQAWRLRDRCFSRHGEWVTDTLYDVFLSKSSHFKVGRPIKTFKLLKHTVRSEAQGLLQSLQDGDQSSDNANSESEPSMSLEEQRKRAKKLTRPSRSKEVQDRPKSKPKKKDRSNSNDRRSSKGSSPDPSEPSDPPSDGGDSDDSNQSEKPKKKLTKNQKTRQKKKCV